MALLKKCRDNIFVKNWTVYVNSSGKERINLDLRHVNLYYL